MSSIPSSIEFPFSTSKTTTQSIGVATTADSLLVAASVEISLIQQFQAGTLTSYSDQGTAPATGNAEMIVADAGALDVTSDNTTVVLVTDAAAGAFVIGGFGTEAQTVVGGLGGGLTYIANSNTGLVLAGGGNNLINLNNVGSGFTVVTTGGDNAIDATTGNNTISAGTGSNTIALGAGNNLVYSTGADQITIQSNTVAANDTISALGDNSGLIVDDANNHVTFLNGNGASQFSGGAGSDTVYAGVGGGTVTGGTGGNNLLVAGTGAVTITGGGNGDELALTTGKAADVLQAGSGNETLLGGLSQGADTFQAGTGNDSISGGFGKDTFTFVNGQAGGTDTISGFNNHSGNSISLQGYDANAVAEAVASAKTSHGSTTFTLSDNTSVTLTGVTHLSASNFS